VSASQSHRDLTPEQVERLREKLRAAMRQILRERRRALEEEQSKS
jgi:hypothetical protein